MKALGVSGFAFAILLGTLASERIRADDGKTGPSEKLSKKLNKTTLDILKHADRVEVFQINPDDGARGEPRIGKFAIVSTGKEQGKAFAGRLAAILLKDETYFGRSFKCFHPGVGFKVWSGKQSVDVAVCYDCSNLEVDNAFGHFGGSKEGIYGQLVKLAKEAFPKDRSIQKLPDRTRLDNPPVPPSGPKN